MFSSLTRLLWEKQMDWFKKNNPRLYLFEQCTSLSIKIRLCSSRTSGKDLLVIINGNSQRAGTCSIVSHKAQIRACCLGLSVKLKEHNMSQTQHHSPLTQYFPLESPIQLNYKAFSFQANHCIFAHFFFYARLRLMGCLSSSYYLSFT